MCGLAGWIATERPGLDRATLATMLQSIRHRGPDGEGMVDWPVAGGRRVFLGHRRLAIIDLTGAPQPMVDEQAGLSLVFNGEIYNFRSLRQTLIGHGYHFARDSDTEVLLRAYQHWGEDVVHHLRGSFAFVIWDAPRGRLVMARDRFGEKPLYWRQTGEGLFFASEAKALLCLPGPRPATDLGAVWDYLAYRYVPGPKTLFTGLYKLKPGCLGIWKAGQFTERRYWTPPDRQARRPLGDNPCRGGDFLACLEQAVQLQMVSDVPFGAFLSGGLDSSMIVALMRRHSPQVNTFSVGFGDDPDNELAYAAQVAQQFGTTHHALSVSHRELMDDLPRLVGFRDAPVAEPSDIAIYRLALTAASRVKMVLTGEGSDEILGGYPKHVFERFAGAYQMLPGTLRHRLLAPLVHALPYGFRRAKTALSNLNIEDRQERFVRWFGALSQAERGQLSVLPPGPPASPDAPPFDTSADNSALRRILYFDQTSWLPDNLLERGDRMTMAASIEARVPFLDHGLAEYVSALPDHVRVRGLRTKWLLREAGRHLLPDRILNRPKVGFRVPVHRWFRGPMRDYLVDHLGSPQALTRQYFDAPTLDRLLAEHLAGRHNHEKLLWSLLNLEIWHRHYAQP